jgi:hypothetical protein
MSHLAFDMNLRASLQSKALSISDVKTNHIDE